MKIKLIPETEEEKSRMGEVEHSGVKTFFMFGSKIDQDGDILEFHDWHGGYKYLVGSLYYFTNFI